MAGMEKLPGVVKRLILSGSSATIGMKLLPGPGHVSPAQDISKTTFLMQRT